MVKSAAKKDPITIQASGGQAVCTALWDAIWKNNRTGTSGLGKIIQRYTDLL